MRIMLITLLLQSSAYIKSRTMSASHTTLQRGGWGTQETKQRETKLPPTLRELARGWEALLRVWLGISLQVVSITLHTTTMLCVTCIVHIYN